MSVSPPSLFVTLVQARAHADVLAEQGDDLSAHVIRYLCQYIEQGEADGRKLSDDLLSLWAHRSPVSPHGQANLDALAEEHAKGLATPPSAFAPKRRWFRR